jgi:hypothetical protein
MPFDDDDLTPEDLDFRGVTSRYADVPGVFVDVANIPEGLRELLSLAKYWAIGDDEERLNLMLLAPAEDLRAFAQAVAPLREEIWAWCRAHDSDIPVPDEVVMYDMMLQAADEVTARFTDYGEEPGGADLPT